MNRRINILCLVGVLILLFGGCSGKQDDSDIKGDDVAQNMYEYEGVKFAYVIDKEGAIITGIVPDSGEKLVFPEYIGEYKVYNLSSECVINYKDVKFANVKSGADGIKENDIIEKVTFYEGVEENTFWVLSKLSVVKEVTFPEGVTLIRAWFASSGAIEKVVLPTTVTTIGNDAFSNSSLKEINLSNVLVINNGAFAGCKNLESADLSNITKIGDSAFENCSSLSHDIIFNKLDVHNAGEYAFRGCAGMNGKKVVFMATQQPNTSDIPATFYGLSEIIIEGESVEEGVKAMMKRTGVSKLLLKFKDSVTEPTDIGYENIKCSSEEFIQSLLMCFDGKILKPGDKMDLSDIKDVLNKIKDDGRRTNIEAYIGAGATKYRFVEGLIEFINGEELNKKVVGFWEDGSDKEIEYDPVDFGMEIEYTGEATICFVVKIGKSKNGAYAFIQAVEMD